MDKMDGIKWDDDPYYLGLLLYRRGREHAVSAEELKVKADQILTYLNEQGKIEMDDERIIRKLQQSAQVSAAKSTAQD